MTELDEIDRRMIDELLVDGRLSVPALAERVGVGRATAYNRFDRLVDEGVIDRFVAVVDHEALGLQVAALVLVNVEQGRWREVQAGLGALPGVEWIGLATGSFDFILLVRCEDLTRLRDVLLVGLHEVPGVRSAETVVLLDEPAPPPPARAQADR